MKLSKKMIFIILFIVSLIFVFFIGRSFDPETGDRKLIFTLDGISHFRKGLDVSGGTRLVYKISYDKYEKIYTNVSELNEIKTMIENIIIRNIDNRISKLGVSDYRAYMQNLDNQHYIVVEIGGITNLDQAKDLIGKTLELEFKLENPVNPNAKTFAARKALADQILAEVKANPDNIAQQFGGRMSENIYHNVFSDSTLDQLPDIYKNNPKMLDDAEIGKVYGLIKGIYTTIYPQSDNTLIQGTGINLDGYTLYRVLDRKEEKDALGNITTLYTFEDVFVQDRESWIPAIDQHNNILNGAYFKYANTSTSEVGEPVVVINLDDKGKEIFCNITQDNIGKPMAIFVGGNMLTAPTIQSKICGGTAEIDGSFTTESAKELVNALNEGTLPAPLILMQEEKISPSLGENALDGALLAALIGFVAIIIFIYFMYGIKNMIVTGVVLIAFLTVLAAFMKITDYALSLSGIAVIILSIGMSVDANILIFERMREELKEGKSIGGSIDNAKDRSRPAIRDGNISTGLIAFVLFSMGTNIFRGFGSMLIVTMFITLLLNVPLTKMLLHAFYTPTKNNEQKSLTF